MDFWETFSGINTPRLNYVIAKNKYTKHEVHYRDGTNAKHCSICEHYDNGTCNKVSGIIRPKMLCDLYDPSGDDDS